ncbi:AAC(3) family N-acetyltransferase (plasmid) [Salmonella enterica]
MAKSRAHRSASQPWGYPRRCAAGHSSFRSVRPLEDGPLGLIEALRAALGSGRDARHALVVRSGRRAVRSCHVARYTGHLGVVSDTFWRLPNVKRSAHPFAFAAAGPQAEQIISDPLPLPPHSPASPVARVHELDGQVLLLGVGHDANTTLHLAELMAKVPYGVPRHCTILQDGKLVRVDYLENDHCCERFALADRWLKEKSLQKEGPVGHAFARLIRSRDIVATALGQLGRDPLIFLHPPEAGCEECDAARQSIG